MAKLIEKTVVMDGKAIERALTRIAHEIIEKNKGTKDVIIVGIRKRGVPLAERLSSIIENIEGVHIPIGVLDITLYRDDLAHMSYQPLIQETHIDEDITNRYYQIEAIKAVAERLEARHRGALLVMATGTGKTRTSAALIDVLSKANWAKKILFLADRTALVNQAKNNLNDYLPNLPSVNLVNEKEDIGSRIIFSTYQTLINLIDNEKSDNTKTYGVGHFDVIIFDEIHRSVYNKYKAIFNYFDGLKIGLTATPVDFSERNTYELFGLTTGNPTCN